MRKARQRTLYCTPVEKATIQAAAVKLGDPVSRFVIASGLRNAAALGEGPVGEPLALTVEEQRALVEGMERLTALDTALREPLPGVGVTALEALAFVHRRLAIEPDRAPPPAPDVSGPAGGER